MPLLQTKPSQKKYYLLVYSCIVITGIIFSFPNNSHLIAQQVTPDNLQEKISTYRNEIELLEKEIEKDRAEIAHLSGQKKSLSNEISLLDATRAKLQKEVSVTLSKIRITDAEIETIGENIDDKERVRVLTVNSLAETLRSIQRADNISIVESLLSKESISQVWEDIDMIQSLQTALASHLASVITIKEELIDKKTETEKKRAELAAYNNQLADQRSVIDYTAKQKNTLLSSVRNQESQYQKLLSEKLQKKQAFEKELLDFEAELRFITDPTMIPPPQIGTLNWPLKNIRITQVFGDTEFSRQNAGVYNGKGHNGIDLGAPIGTPILSAQSGTIEGVGDTDTVCPGASYGKWVLIRHRNGLSTLYAHLSIIKVTTGQEVTAGETIGYIGVTGYTTGPHLHFTVYASQGVKILDRKSVACGGTYRMPIADLRAYLNPLLYLPK